MTKVFLLQFHCFTHCYWELCQTCKVQSKFKVLQWANWGQFHIKDKDLSIRIWLLQNLPYGQPTKDQKDQNHSQQKETSSNMLQGHSNIGKVRVMIKVKKKYLIWYQVSAAHICENIWAKCVAGSSFSLEHWNTQSNGAVDDRPLGRDWNWEKLPLLFPDPDPWNGNNRLFRPLKKCAKDDISTLPNCQSLICSSKTDIPIEILKCCWKYSPKYFFLFALLGIEEYKFPPLLLLTLAPVAERARTAAA